MKTITLFKALADETRIRVLHLLMHQELNVNEIVDILGIGQSRISRHLKILSESGLLCSRRDGLWNFYSAAATAQAKAFLDGIAPILDAEPLLKTDLDLARRVSLERKRESKKFFNSIAEDWDRIKKELLDGFDLNALIADRITPCGTSVDVGCGTGDLLPVLKERSQKVIGVDNSPAMLERARVRFSGDGDSIDLRLGEIEHLPLSNGEAECAVLNMVLHHLASPLEGISEVRRVLNSGNRLLIVDFEKHEREALRTQYGDRWLGFDRVEIGEWLRRSGFILNKTECIGVNMGLTLCIYDATRT